MVRRLNASRRIAILTSAALGMFPDATVLHLGLFRDKMTLQAIEWVHPLPRLSGDGSWEG